MATNYIWNTNPIQDILMNMLLSNVNITNGDAKQELHNIFTQVIEPYLNNSGDLVYLDFNIKNNKNYYRVISNNLVSALWLSGILPENPNEVMRNNRYKYGNFIYHYDIKTHKLVYSIKEKKNDIR
jgi:hypothetical protein